MNQSVVDPRNTLPNKATLFHHNLKKILTRYRVLLTWQKDTFLRKPVFYRSLKNFKFEKMTCQHDDKSFSQDLQDLSYKANILNRKICWVTRDKSLVKHAKCFQPIKTKLHLHGKSVVDIEITQASSVQELLPKKQKNVMWQNLSLTW